MIAVNPAVQTPPVTENFDLTSVAAEVSTALLLF